MDRYGQIGIARLEEERNCKEGGGSGGWSTKGRVLGSKKAIIVVKLDT